VLPLREALFQFQLFSQQRKYTRTLNSPNRNKNYLRLEAKSQQEINTNMKLSHIFEAGYYRNDPSVDEVSNLYWEVYEDKVHPSDITVLKPGLYETGTTIRIYVHNRSEDEALSVAKAFMEEHNLPYTGINEVDAGADGMIVTFKYMEKEYR